MTLSVWYWIIMALCLFWGLWNDYSIAGPPWRGGRTLIVFLLFLIIGLKIFGSPIQ